MGKNLFIITFTIETGKYKVVSGKSWLFDGYLFALKDLDGDCHITKRHFESKSFKVQLHELPVRYMDCCYGSLIGNTIGKVMDVDMDEDDTGWEKFLRVQVELNLSKPLERVHSLQVKGEKLKIPIQ